MSDETVKSARITSVLIPVLNETCIFPKQLHVREEWRGPVLRLIATPCMADASTLIGKGARIVNAYKYIVKEAGRIVGLEEAEFVLENDHHGDSTGERAPDFDYHFDSIKPLIEPLCELLFGKITVKAVEERDTIYVYIQTDKPADMKLLWAVSDIFYPIGYRRRKIKVKPATTKTIINENDSPRKSEVLGGKRKRSAKLLPR